MVFKVVKNIPEEEYKKCFDKLLERMGLCINHHGDYFEHLIKYSKQHFFCLYPVDDNYDIRKNIRRSITWKTFLNLTK